MSKSVTIHCDLDGSAGAETHKVVLDETVLVIDLSEASYEKLKKVLAPFMKVGTVSTKANGVDTELAQIRAWAASQGITVAPKGRVAADVVAQYEAAHPAA